MFTRSPIYDHGYPTPKQMVTDGAPRDALLRWKPATIEHRPDGILSGNVRSGCELASAWKEARSVFDQDTYNPCRRILSGDVRCECELRSAWREAPLEFNPDTYNPPFDFLEHNQEWDEDFEQAPLLDPAEELWSQGGPRLSEEPDLNVYLGDGMVFARFR